MDTTPATAMLHIGDAQTTLCFEIDGAASTTLTLALGAQTTARTHFRHNPPSALEMENAIAAVEDLVMPLHRQLPPGLALHTHDAAVRTIARLSGVPEGARMELSIDALEDCFNELAAWVQGRPASQGRLPQDHPFAATLLILRELMHHLGFASIYWMEALPAA
jgi:exopolyphosphatase/pppGpp-phosphohydrolase